jgi:hypothetical protein
MLAFLFSKINLKISLRGYAYPCPTLKRLSWAASEGLFCQGKSEKPGISIIQISGYVKQIIPYIFWSKNQG